MMFPRTDDPPPLEGDIEFQVVDWFVPENDKSRQKRDRDEGYPRPAVPCAPAEYEIFMFGATADGHSVTAKVKGFMPYFYVKVPQTWRQDDVDALKERLMYDKVEMRKANGDTYMSTVVRYTLREAGHLADMTLEDHKDFWGFTNFADFKFMRVTVKSLRLYNDLKRYFMMKSHLYQLYESNIDPFLRFIHERDIQPCGWVRIPEGGYDVIDPDASDSEGSGSEDEDLPPWERRQRPLKPTVTACHARTNYCIEVDYENVHGLGYNKIAPLLIASFDIECTSSHGDFPVAIKNYRKLTIDLIALSRRRTAEITKEELCRLVPLAFFESTDPNPISRLYAKKAKSLTLEAVQARLEPIADEILMKLKAALKGKARAKASADGGGEADDSDDDDALARPALASAAAEAELTTFLTKHLPALAGDPVIQIGTTVHRYGSDQIIYRHIATYKSCADIPDAEVEAKKKESECIMAWKDMITRLDPDIITGYNIFGFDAKYIADRARELGIYDEFVFGLGRLKNRHCDLEERKLSSSALGDNIMYCFDLDGVVQIDMLKVMQRDHKLDSYKLDSVAGKFIVESAQVLSITQPSSNAESAANEPEDDSDAETAGDQGLGLGLDVFRAGAILKTDNTSGLKDGNYIRLDGSDKIRVLAVNEGEGTITLADPLPKGMTPLTVGQKLKWALVKDDISPNEIFAKFGGNSRDRMEIAKYCLQDCALVNRLLHKLKVMENNIGMGNVCYVPLSYLFMRGQGVKIFSLVARECRLKNHLIPVVRSARDTLTDAESDAVGYEGAIVLPPQEGMYLDDPITVLDYSSLYPSSMISRNISHDAFVFPDTPKTTMESAATAGVTFHDITFDEYEGTGDKKRIKGQKTCTFAQLPEGRKGIIPSILQMLLTQRKNTRKKIEYETLTLTSGEEITGLVKECAESPPSLAVTDVDSGKSRTVPTATVTSRRDTFNEFEKAVLDARQLAYKVTANSLYGQTGSRTSPIFLLEVAACTTATGRNMIMLAKGFVEREYGAEVIYGDTDSIFCRFKNDGLKGKDALPLAIAAGQRASREIKAHLPAPQCLEYEKTLWPFILFSKKRYVGNLYEDDHLKKPKQKSMGIVLKRRDNAQIVKIIYGGIIDILMKEGSLAESIAFLKSSLQDLVDGKVPLEHLVISKTLKGDYKDPTKIAHRVLADRIGERDPGNKPMVNDRVPFVYIIPPASVVEAAGGSPILQGDRIEHPDFIRQENLKPDYQFYITNQLLKPISQLYALCVTQIDGYSLAPNYWLQIDAEMEGTPMYSNDKKRKDRIGRMKMKEVKELLFDPYIEALASPSRPRKKATRKAKGTTAGGAEDLCEYVLEIKAVEKKRGAQYECTVTFTHTNTDIVADDTTDPATTPVPAPIWTIEKVYKGKKAETLRMAAVEGVNKIATDAESPESAPMFAVTCADKTFLRAWRAALKAQASAECGDDTDPLDGMKAVRTSLDMSDLDAQREMNGFTGLVNARQRLNYILL
jgi:DNA polymerase elongation subunit (family B)